MQQEFPCIFFLFFFSKKLKKYILFIYFSFFLKKPLNWTIYFNNNHRSTHLKCSFIKTRLKYVFYLGCVWYCACDFVDKKYVLNKITKNESFRIAFLKIRGNYLFFSKNYQKMHDTPMNYQLNQNRVFNYQRQPFSPIPLVRGVKRNSQRVMCRFTWGHVERWW